MPEFSISVLKEIAIDIKLGNKMENQQRNMCELEMSSLFPIKHYFVCSEDYMQPVFLIRSSVNLVAEIQLKFFDDEF